MAGGFYLAGRPQFDSKYNSAGTLVVAILIKGSNDGEILNPKSLGGEWKVNDAGGQLAKFEAFFDEVTLETTVVTNVSLASGHIYYEATSQSSGKVGLPISDAYMVKSISLNHNPKVGGAYVAFDAQTDTTLPGAASSLSVTLSPLSFQLRGGVSFNLSINLASGRSIDYPVVASGIVDISMKDEYPDLDWSTFRRFDQSKPPILKSGEDCVQSIDVSLGDTSILQDRWSASPSSRKDQSRKYICLDPVNFALGGTSGL